MVLFEDRLDAGEKLAREIMESGRCPMDPLILALPRGGIPVGLPVARACDAGLDFLVLRKLPIPDNPEAGFGAVTLGKVVILNSQMLPHLHLSQAEIDSIIDDVYDEVVRRDSVFRRGRPAPDLKDRSVILVDDGLASGYTMLAAVNYARKRKVKSILVAVPVAHDNAYALIEKNVDDMIVYHVSNKPVFALASFYRKFPDLSDDEVIDLLDRRISEMERTKRNIDS